LENFNRDIVRIFGKEVLKMDKNIVIILNNYIPVCCMGNYGMLRTPSDTSVIYRKTVLCLQHVTGFGP
jgi:hypothetical protein